MFRIRNPIVEGVEPLLSLPQLIVLCPQICYVVVLRSVLNNYTILDQISRVSLTIFFVILKFYI